jgi:NADH:ubiquinone oxidoreductase subunit F (NADH-binding)
MVDQAGLLGRGGAAFPTATKLRAVAESRSRHHPTVIVNACEGEPISAKDRTLLARSPHLILDGAQLAARAIGAKEIVVCVHKGTHFVPIHGDVPVRVQPVPHRYVASEESALINLLETGDAHPTTTPPRPAERGLLVANAETLAQLTLIARHGPAWYRREGTRLVTVSGAVTAPGVHEVPLAASLNETLTRAGASADAQAVLAGGVAGTWCHPDDHAPLPALGALFVLPANACGVTETARITQFLAEESARQCGPCMFGLPAVATDLTHLARGLPADVTRLRHRLTLLPNRGACRHPDGATRVTQSALRMFATDVANHLAGRPCAHGGRAHIPLRSTQ